MLTHILHSSTWELPSKTIPMDYELQVILENRGPVL